MAVEVCVPHPEQLIKSIAEQGYTLETSVADLIDNSITAGARRIEVLVDTQKTPFRLFIADDGNGMSEEELKKSMNFPSKSMEDDRSPGDLGRFGLGLKTASFAQTRCFTVISKRKEDKKYNARTWDVNHLKTAGVWELLVNTDKEIDKLLTEYRTLSKDFLNPFTDYSPTTIIVWDGLYKFEDSFSSGDNYSTLQKELTETTKEYLQLIFHRFMEMPSPLKIRLNNEQLIPFNPFPAGARKISVQQKLLMGNKLHLEGYVLPNRCIAESKGVSEWTLTHKSLMDMEGIYIYRANRIIVFGGWSGIIKKSPRLQLARLKVEIGNGIDHLFHLNVAKSSIAIPFSERVAFLRYISELKKEAEKEFFNYETRAKLVKTTLKTVFKKIPTNKGMALGIDEEFPILKALMDTLTEAQTKQLKIILRMITTTMNKMKRVDTTDNYISIIEKDGIHDEDLQAAIQLLLASGVSKENILDEIIPMLGITHESLPPAILHSLK